MITSIRSRAGGPLIHVANPCSGADDDERRGDGVERVAAGGGRRRRARRPAPTPDATPSWKRCITAVTRSSLTGVSGATTSEAPKAPRALDSPSSVPPLIAADVATLHAESTTTSGIWSTRSRS